MGSLYSFYEVNAFTHKGTSAVGNPAAICVVRAFPDEQMMARAAKLLQKPMISFVRYTDDPHVFDIRHFSPDGKENHVCGHATLAAAELLASMTPALRQGRELTFRLNPQYAINADNAFKVRIKGSDIFLTLPAVTELERVDDPDFYRLLAEALRIDARDIVKPSYYAPRIINYVVELRDQKTLLGLKPDFQKLKALALSKDFSHEGIMATAKSEISGYDILTRVFMPVIDVDEDIACGSANCSVVPYWAVKRKGAFPEDKTTFKALFPYPPRMKENKVGGVQELQMDHRNQEIILKGQGTCYRIIRLDLSPDLMRRFAP